MLKISEENSQNWTELKEMSGNHFATVYNKDADTLRPNTLPYFYSDYSVLHVLGQSLTETHLDKLPVILMFVPSEKLLENELDNIPQ